MKNIFKLAVAILLFLPACSFAYPLYQANSDVVLVAPYDTPVSGAGNLGYAAAGSREFFNYGQRFRIRQNGTISRVRLYIADASHITGFYIKIWRKTGTNSYDLVGTSNNLASSLVSSSFNSIDLASPITGVQEGDYYGYRLETSASDIPFVTHAGALTNIYYVTNSTPGSTGFNWESQTDPYGTGNTMPIQFYMQAPQAVFIGDSFMAGHYTHYSFLETTRTTNIESTLEKQFANLTAYTYQNMGVGSQNTTQIAARFTTDVVNLHPRLVVIEGGANDNFLGGAPAKTLFLNNWASMLTEAQNSSSITTVIVLKILPCTNIYSGCSNTEQQITDDWNNSLASLAAGYSKAIVVDTSPYVGQFRAGGDPGNLWDINPLYDYGDNLHYNQAGNLQVAHAILDNLPKPYVTFDNDFSQWTTGNVPVHYNLIQIGDNSNINISQTATSGVEYSTDGTTWYDATQGGGGDPLTGLTGAPSPGTDYTFVWDTVADIVNTKDSTVYIRIRPNDGNTDGSSWIVSNAFGVNNFSDTPTNLSATINDTKAVLSVNAFAHDNYASSGYYFYDSKGKNSGWTHGNTWQDTDLICGNMYTFSVKYRNGNAVETDPISVSKNSSDCGAVSVASLVSMQPAVQTPVFSLKSNIPDQVQQNAYKKIILPNPKNIHLGQKSTDVKILQSLLSKDKTLFPEDRVSGYYGPLTQKAIQKFQLKYGVLKSSKDKGFGIVGAATLSKLQEVFDDKVS